jgi:hypothetical protein
LICSRASRARGGRRGRHGWSGLGGRAGGTQQHTGRHKSGDETASPKAVHLCNLHRHGELGNIYFCRLSMTGAPRLSGSLGPRRNGAARVDPASRSPGARRKASASFWPLGGGRLSVTAEQDAAPACSASSACPDAATCDGTRAPSRQARGPQALIRVGVRRQPLS